MSDFSQNGINYRITRLNTIDQFHLNRKIGPLIPPLIPVFMKIAADQAKGKETPIDVAGIGELVGPFAEGLAKMTDEDSEAVINKCLSSVQREVSPNVYSRVWDVNAKISPFPEFNDLSSALPIIMKVIWDALGPFINGLLTKGEPVKSVKNSAA